MKRILASLLLLSSLAAAATPCQAAFMQCGMKMPSADSRCDSCGAEKTSVPDLTAGSCCTVSPGEDRAIAPALSAPATASPDAARAALSVPSTVAAAAEHAPSLRPGFVEVRFAGPSPPSLRTTVLRR